MTGATGFQSEFLRVRDRRLPLGAEADFTDAAIVENVEAARRLLDETVALLPSGLSRARFCADVRRATGLLDMALAGLDRPACGKQ